MKAIDFLSNSPNNYIFQKETYKTNLGGFLFLFFFITMLIITVSYIIDYVLNDKYEIEYLKIINQVEESDIERMNKDPNLNPTLEFRLQVLEPFSAITSDFLMLYEKDGGLYFGNRGKYYNTSDGLTFDFFLNSSTSNLAMYLAYYCGDDPKCIIKDEGHYISEDLPIYYQFLVPTALIDHESSNPFINEKILQNFLYDSTFKSYKRYVYEWNVIKYKEKKGISRIFDNILGLKSEYYAGDVKDFAKFEDEEWIIDGGELGYFRLLALFRMINTHHNYDEYRRRKISLLDVLSKVSALFFPVRMVFIFILQLYSPNFENYKIIETILNKTNNRYKEIRLKTSIELGDKTLNENKNINNSKMSDPLIESEVDNNSITNAKQNNIDNRKPNDDDEIKENKTERILPKYSFMKFFLNNCYWNCCRSKKNKQQEILLLCNDTIKKYLSVDSIVLNQIYLENLIKYHKSNNNLLNNIDNNELILNLKELI